MRYTSRASLVIPALALVAVLFMCGCEDDPIVGPTDKNPGGGSYGVIHFNRSEDVGSAERLQEFLSENPRRF